MLPDVSRLVTEACYDRLRIEEFRNYLLSLIPRRMHDIFFLVVFQEHRSLVSGHVLRGLYHANQFIFTEETNT